MEETRTRRLLTIPAVSRQLGVSTKILKEAIDSGALVSLRLTDTGWRRIEEAELARFLAARRIRTGRRRHHDHAPVTGT